MKKVSSETLLEMYFARDMAIAMNKKYGATNNVHFLKPSPHDEGWLGFDQSWGAPATLTNEQFVALLKRWLIAPNQIALRFSGEFHQYKRVYQLSRVGTRHSATTKSVLQTRFPGQHCKIDLLTQPNDGHPLSQHQMLTRLANVRDAQVFYTCPVVLDQDIQMWLPADLTKINWIKVTAATLEYDDGASHHVYFDDENDRNPLWCSEPVKGTSLNLWGWMDHNNTRQLGFDSRRLVSFLDDVGEVVNEHYYQFPQLPNSLRQLEGERYVEDTLDFFEANPINTEHFPKNFVLAVQGSIERFIVD